MAVLTDVTRPTTSAAFALLHSFLKGLAGKTVSFVFFIIKFYKNLGKKNCFMTDFYVLGALKKQSRTQLNKTPKSH